MVYISHNVYLELYHEEEEVVVDIIGIVTRCTLLSSTVNKEKERIDTNLETISTSVIWN